ncbi:MAG TPA: serine hydrolase domain-containing protein [Lacunisphaera sp.]|jgi:CubicO group peptidase (beta-lactamase class C family)|nr:serine hydrolase domain-containing protein [Lacunisphaera sp.]
MKTMPRLLACVLLATSVLAAEPFRFPRSTPEAEGVSSADILKFLDEAEPRVDGLNSFMLVRHGKVVAEGWWAPYAADEPHMMYSLSKSFTSTAIGLAVAEGRLSIDDHVLKFFPDLAPEKPSENLRNMRVRDLLTMNSGQHAEDVATLSLNSPGDLVKQFLALPVAHKPGTHFVYNSPASYVLSAIVQKLTGQTVRDYLRPRIFEPLGIDLPEWDQSAQGINLGASGLHIKTEDIARFGQLYLQKGQWNGRQLLPADWIAQATARQVSNGSDPLGNWDQGYGFQFWRCPHGFYRGDGAFGQFCIVMDQYDAVLAITSGTRDMAAVMNSAWTYLLPAFHDGALPADAAADAKLQDRLAHLMVPPQRGNATSPAAAAVTGRVYKFPENDRRIESLSLDSVDASGATKFTAHIAGTEQHFTAAPGSWHKGGAIPTPTGPEPIAASGAWTSDYEYTLKLCGYRSTFTRTFRLRFADQQLLIDSEVNVGFGGTAVPTLTGTAE